MLSTSSTEGLHRVERNGVQIWRAGLRNFYWPRKQRPNPAARLLWHVLDSFNPFMQHCLRQVLEIERPDVVSVHNLPGWSAAAWQTIRQYGVPMVQVLHDQYAICPKTSMFKGGANCTRQCATCSLLRLPHRTLSNHVSAVVGVSKFILQRHLDFGYFANVSIRPVIHNARRTRDLGLDEAGPTGNSCSGIRIGFIGRLDPTKGVDRLLEAFASLALPNAELWIAGSGKADHEAALRALSTDHRVRFLGQVAPADFYPHVDIVVVPSLWQEPLGMVVVEAFAFGKPVIGSRRGGIPEMIRDGENGLLFEPDRPNELLAALQRLAGDRDLRSRMGDAARIAALPFLDHQGWISRHLNVYTAVAHQTTKATQ